MVEILFLFSVLFLFAGWVFWLRDRGGRSLQTWRKFLAWIAMLSLSGSVLSFGRFLMMVRRADYSFINDLVILLPILRTVFWLAVPPLFLCWFATPKAAICLAASTVLILFLWAAAGMGI